MKNDDQQVVEPGLVLEEDFVVENDSVSEVWPEELNEESSQDEVIEPEIIEVSEPTFVDNTEDEEIEFVVHDDIGDVVENTGTSVANIGNRGIAGVGENKKRIGDQLVEMGVITADQLNVALQEKKLSGKMIGEVLVDLGFIDAETLSSYLAQASGFQTFDPKNTILDGKALELIEKPLAVKHSILPVSINGDDLLVAMADPYDVVALDILKKHIPKNLKVKPIVGTPKVLSDAIDAAYGNASTVNAILKELEGKNPDDLDELTELSEEEAYSHPLVRLVNALIFEAVKVGASDLHFEPEENFVRLRYRKDGVLSTVQILHKQHWNGISQRIKLMASLNIADKLTPQDGRIRMTVGGHEVDFRVSSLPTVHGENIVMRVLDKQSSIMPLSKLGFSEENRKRIERAQKKPEGIIIVTGPTGSGKTTSLYSMLNEINTVDVNIQTLEDPVEYSLPMIRQTPVKEGVLEFADGIRALLRQDPDIIFIGEIRDKLTAEMALQAAMTGHQVYTTLHTNDSFGALPRLFDLGMVPGMVAGNIISVFAQRLTRTLCDNCKEPHTTTEEEMKILGIDEPAEIFKARQGGCQMCDGQGYKGRCALAEILLFDEDMDEVVAKKGSKGEIKRLAVSKGFKSMKDDAILKILEGKTTFEAVSKVVDISAD
ncbi:MAG: ATPase, T2SS/T4P/T4SS family [Pseudomonadota bacterium]